jgi:hypothetical protein
MLLVTVALVLAAMIAVSALPVFAAPNRKASCEAQRSYTFGHWQFRDEDAHDTKELAAQQGTTSGARTSSEARSPLRGDFYTCVTQGG